MLSWKTFKDCLVGGSVEVAIWGISVGLTGRRARMSEAFIVSSVAFGGFLLGFAVWSEKPMGLLYWVPWGGGNIINC